MRNISPQHRVYTRNKSDKGFGLVEALICVVILSIGLMGMATVVLLALQTNTASNNLLTAQLLANNMANRITANLIEKQKGLSSAYLLSAKENTNCYSPSGNQACTSSELAQHELYIWQQELTDRLPEGSGVVCVDSQLSDGSPTYANCDGKLSQSTSPFAIKIWWQKQQTETSTDTIEAYVRPV